MGSATLAKLLVSRESKPHFPLKTNKQRNKQQIRFKVYLNNGQGRSKGRGGRGKEVRAEKGTKKIWESKTKHLTGNQANQIKYSRPVPEEPLLKLEMIDKKEIASICPAASLSSFIQKAH